MIGEESNEQLSIIFAIAACCFIADTINHIYKWKSRKAQKRIVAGAHTLEEMVSYADEKYHLTEVTESHRKYSEQRKCLKESLISRHKSELLGDLPK